VGPDREALELYVSTGKLMQVATVSAAGEPALCHVWYRAAFRPDELYFMSRPDRAHSANVRDNQRAAGGIVTTSLTGLGQTVCGVTFKGHATQLEGDATEEIAAFTRRWPEAGTALTSRSSRLYRITVSEWVLFDEDRHPGSPRRVIPPAT